MDYSAANTGLWNVIIQFGIIAAFVLLSNFLYKVVPAIKKTFIPIPVLAGFILLIIKYTGLISLDKNIMEILVYHGIALGFIAMSLCVPEKRDREDTNRAGLKSGALIVSSYLIQAFIGLVITISLSYTLLPNLFKASGLLLPMGFGQGPGQANNIGLSYENLGFYGGKSFGLSIAAAGYLVACIVGVIIINLLAKKGEIDRNKIKISEEKAVTFFESKGEISLSDAIDKFSLQFAMVMVVYMMTYLIIRGVTSGLSTVAPGVGNTLNSLLWGFNFIIASAIAIAFRQLLRLGRNKGYIKKQYQNNYLLNRISGLFFDIMIIAGIASIDFEDLSGLWIPFVLLIIAGAIVTWLHLRFVCKRIYPGYYYEGLISMFGMMTGTISSGVLLLREIDPNYQTPGANNLVLGSSFGIIFGAPMLAFVGLAAKSTQMCFVTLGLVVIYYLILMFFLCVKGKKG